MRHEDAVGKFFRHRKGGQYQVKAIAQPITPEVLALSRALKRVANTYLALHSETLELIEVYETQNGSYVLGSEVLVIYQEVERHSEMAPDGVWGRSEQMFFDGRFTQVERDADSSTAEAH